MTLDLHAIRQRAEARLARGEAASPARRLTEDEGASQLATLATLARTETSIDDTALAATLAAAINRACDARGDDDENRRGLLVEVRRLSSELQSDMLAHFTMQAEQWEAINRHHKGAT